MRKNVYIVGGGITGCSLAHFLKKDFSVTLFEKSKSLGGLLKTYQSLENIPYQKIPSIIHTNKKWIIDFVKSFLDIQKIDYKVAINPIIDFQYYEFPFTRYTLDRMPWHWKESASLELETIDGSFGDNLEQTIINFYGKTLFEIFYKNLILKWFGKEASEIDNSSFFKKNLKPILRSYSYFNEQGWFPKDVGYNTLFDKLTSGVDVILNHTPTINDFKSNDIVILTTRIDSFLLQSKIPFITSSFDIDSVVYSENKPDTIFYPNYVPFLSMTQFGKMFPNRLYENKNIIVRETTSIDGEETYITPDSKSISIHKSLEKNLPENIFTTGWQASYSYKNIAQSIDDASRVASLIKHRHI